MPSWDDLDVDDDFDMSSCIDRCNGMIKEMLENTNSEYERLPTETHGDDSEVDDDFNMDSCIDRCNAMVVAMLEEANRALNEPRLPLVLTQGAYEAEDRKAAGTAVTAGSVYAVLINAEEGCKRATEILQAQKAPNAALHSLDTFHWLTALNRNTLRSRLSNDKMKQA